MNYNNSTHFKVWCSYHLDSLVSEYNLQEDENIVLYNTSEQYSGNCLNFLNRFLSEFVCLVYPWQNNIQSDFIGFHHYNRKFDISSIDFSKFELFDFQYFKEAVSNKLYTHNVTNAKSEYIGLESHLDQWGIVDAQVGNDLRDYLTTNYSSFLETTETHIHNLIQHSIFVCGWDTYCQLAEYLYNYILFINNRYSLNWDESAFKEYVHQNYIVTCQRTLPYYSARMWGRLWGYGKYIIANNSYNTPGTIGYNLWRILAYNIEYLVSLFIVNHSKFIDTDNLLKDANNMLCVDDFSSDALLEQANEVSIDEFDEFNEEPTSDIESNNAE